VDALFSISAPFSNWRRILDGELHPMQALLTQKLRVRGNMAYLMRHVPTVLDFTRCAQELTQGS
jgi:putative sterol carrier protein